MYIELKNMAETIDQGVAKLKPMIKTFIQDKSIPLEQRWDIYTSLPVYYFDYQSDYPDYELNGSEISWYDDHNIERHEIADNKRIMERYENSLGVDPDHYSYYKNVTVESLNQLKEDMLQSGFRTWKMDW